MTSAFDDEEGGHLDDSGDDELEFEGEDEEAVSGTNKKSTPWKGRKNILEIKRILKRTMNLYSI